MRQVALQLKTRIQNTSIVNNNAEFQKTIFYAMLFTVAILILFYVFILGNMVFNITERRVTEKEILTLSNEVSNLELSYLSLSNGIDLALSSSMGFKETKAVFATRKALGFNTAGKDLESIKFTSNEI